MTTVDINGQKVSARTAATSLTTSDTIPIIQSGASKKATLSLLPVSTPQQTALDAKQDKVAPIIADVGTEFSHFYFGPSGIVDTKSVAWTAANAPPLNKIAMPAYAGSTTLNKVGVFSDSNYFTAGSGADAILNFPTGPWICAIEVDHVSHGNSPWIIDNISGGSGWGVTPQNGAGVYVLAGNFDGPLSPALGGQMVAGRNTIICGHDGTQFFIKVNGAPIVKKTVAYSAANGATGKIGRSTGSGGAYNGRIIEIWGSTDTPTDAVINALYAASRKENGNNYRFPNTANTRFHLHSKFFDGTTWTYYPVAWSTSALPTLTTVGTVPSSTETFSYAVADGRYAISPTGWAATLTADTHMYYLPLADNVFNRNTSWHACAVVIPTTGGQTVTQIYMATGSADTDGGWQLVNEDNSDSPSTNLETVFIASTGQMNGPILVGDKVNIVCYGYDAANSKIYLKVNDNPTRIQTATIATRSLGNRRDQANIGGHNDMDIGFYGTTVEHIYRTGAPSDAAFIALQREVLNRS
jgi:hypothetical protein